MDGERVTVVCGRPYYPGGDGAAVQVPNKETIGGVNVRRLWNTTFPKSSLQGKLLNQLTFMASLFFYSLFSLEKRHTVLVTTAPPLGVVCLTPGQLLNRYNIILSVQDLYPDVLAAAGKASPKSAQFRALRRMMTWAMQRCRRVIAISGDMSSHLRLFYRADGVEVIPNPSVGAIEPLKFGEAKLARGWGGKFVVQYSGNLGVAHEYRTMLDVMRRLSRNGDILFHIAGGGSNYGKLMREAEALPNVVFEGYAEESALASHLSIADISVVIFDEAFRDILLPSKYVGILASGRPVLLISGAVSDISRDIKNNSVGLHFGSGEADAIADALEELAYHPRRSEAMGANARSLYERAYSSTDIFERYRAALRE